jgi:hypothetical protein
MTNMNLYWEPVGGGRLTLWHRPKVGFVAALPAAGCTDVVTLLSEREGAPQLGEAVKAAGLGWLWLPMPNGRPPIGPAHDQALQGIQLLAQRLSEGRSALIHCSAGIHRTGMIAYGLLRWVGVAPEEALAKLGRMREHTRAGVRPEHLAWGDGLTG